MCLNAAKDASPPQAHKYWTASYQELFVALIIGIIYYIANLDVSGPAYQQDEIGYLVNGAFFAGHVIDGFSSYHAGYSILLAPLFAIFDDPGLIWRGVLLVNALLWSGSFFLLLKFLKRFLPSASQRTLLLTVGTVALYPAWVSIAGYAFSQSAFVFFFLVSTITLLIWNPEKPAWVILHSSAVGYLYWIHPTAIGVIAASIFTVALICWKNRRWPSLLIHIFSVSLLVLSYKIVLQPWMMRKMTPNGFLPRTHYQDFSYVLAHLRTSRFWIDWILAFAGQFSYLAISTFGLFLFGSVYVLKCHSNIFREKRVAAHSPLADLNATGLFLIGSAVAIMFIGAASFASQEGGPQPRDEWFYGRYAEGVLLPLIAIGLVSIRHSKPIIFSAFIVAWTGWFLRGHANSPNLNFVNIQGFWPSALLPNQSIFVWFLVGALALILSKGLFLRYGIYIVIAAYLLTDYQNFNFHKSIYGGYSKPSGLVDLIRLSVPKGSCIAFDPDLPTSATMQQAERIRLYSYYLFDYSFRRMNVDEWTRNCDGPILTYNSAVSQNRDVTIQGREVDTDLFIAVKDSSANDMSRINHAMHAGMIWSAELGEQFVIDAAFFAAGEDLGRYSQVGKVESGEISSTGHNGYLLFGPYKPLTAGKYVLALDWNVNNGDGVVVDVVSKGGATHARLEGTGTSFEKLPELVIPFSLSSSVTDLEIRVYVTDKSQVRIANFSIIRDH